MKQPERFNFSMLRDALEQTQTQGEGIMFHGRDFAIVGGGCHSRLFHYMLDRQTPLLIDDYRLGLVLEGRIHSRVGLVERHIGPGTLVFIGPGTIVQPLAVTERVRIKGIALFGGPPLTASRLPALLGGSVGHFLLPLSADRQQLVEQLIDTMWLCAHAQPFSRDTFDALTAALMHQFGHLYQLQAEQEVRPSHAADVFNRFIRLVNEHGRREHQLAYYASRLCLTPRYLGTVVHQASGVTAKEWIDRALVTEAKVMLKHTDRSVAQIADELAFPNPSFFSKYFRRLTGMTPAEYRKK